MAKEIALRVWKRSGLHRIEMLSPLDVPSRVKYWESKGFVITRKAS